MKRFLSGILAGLLLSSVMVILPRSQAATDDRLKLSAGSNLTLIQGNTYLTGICGTITADVLADNFDQNITITSPSGDTLKGGILVPSDTVVSNGTSSVKVLIYGDTDRDGTLSLSDVTEILKYIANWNIDICEDAIDLNWDNKYDLSDVTLLLKKIAGWNVCIGVNIVPNQITLSYYDSDCTSIGIMWHTEKKTQNPAVQVVEGETGDFKNARTVTGVTNLGIGDNNSRVIVDSLEYGKTYSYRVGDASGFWSEPSTFTMREEDPEEFTFICFTDSQSQNKNPGTHLSSAWKNAITAHPDTKFAIHCGDVVESVGSGDWDQMIDTSAEYFSSVPVMVVSGNHETSYAGSMGYKMQYNHFFTHMPPQASYIDGYFYSFTYGDVHFVMLNTNKQGTGDDSLSEEQMNWLRSDLEKNTAKWTIAVMHHPMYSTGSGSNDRWEDTMVLAMRDQLSPLFAEYGVDIVLSGHDHIYYCTHPIDGNGNALAETPQEITDGVAYYTSPEGVIYTTPGCTGSSERSLYKTTHPEYYRSTAENLSRSYLVVQVSEDKILAELCVPGYSGTKEVLDSFGIIK